MDNYAPILRLYTDGSCHPNPNADRGGGWGFVLCEPGGEDEPLEGQSGRSPDTHTTNNRMELRAACYGLQHVLALRETGRWLGGAVELWTDSEYVLTRVACKPTPLNGDLVQQLQATIALCRAAGIRVTSHHCRGHAGIPGNEHADALAGLWRCFGWSPSWPSKC
jgi:ribonuclease HI